MSQNEQAEVPPDLLFPTPDTFGILYLLGMKILTSQAGVGRVSLEVDKRLMHPQQIVHGGVIFTLADTAMSMALMSVVPKGTPFGTVEAKINYLLPVRTGELLAEAVIVHQGRTLAVLESTIYNIDGDERRAIARVMGTFSMGRAKATLTSNH